jgi:3-methylcrotonyl-CoA carboxylase alpha subunit
VLARAEASATGHERVVSPMPGTIIRVLVEEGARVTARQSLIVVEAMKMEHAIAAPGDGKIGRIHYRAGDTVAEGPS